MALNLSGFDTVLSAVMLLGEHSQPSAGPKASSVSSASSASSATPGPGGAPIRRCPSRGRPRGPGGLAGPGPVSVSVPSAGGSGVPRRAGSADPSAPAPRGPAAAAGGERDPSFFPAHPRRQRRSHNKCEAIPQRNFKEKLM